MLLLKHYISKYRCAEKIHSSTSTSVNSQSLSDKRTELEAERGKKLRKEKYACIFQRDAQFSYRYRSHLSESLSSSLSHRYMSMAALYCASSLCSVGCRWTWREENWMADWGDANAIQVRKELWSIDWQEVHLPPAMLRTAGDSLREINTQHSFDIFVIAIMHVLVGNEMSFCVAKRKMHTYANVTFDWHQRT